MKHVLNLSPIGGGLWRAELETSEGSRTVEVVTAASMREAWEKAMRLEPDAA